MVSCYVMILIPQTTTISMDTQILLKLNLGEVTMFHRGRYNSSIKNVPVW